MSATKRTPPEQLTEAEERSVINFYRAHSNKDWDLLKSAVTENWRGLPGAPNQKLGPDAYKPVFEKYIIAFPDLSIRVEEIIGVSGRAAVRAELKGTHKAEFQAVPATGKPVCVHFHEFHHFENGLIAKTWYMADWLSMLEQVGAWPPQN